MLGALLRQFEWPLAAGLAAGTILYAFGSKLLRAGLYGVSNLVPASYAAALALLALIATLSMLLPAARTLRLNVATILHREWPKAQLIQSARPAPGRWKPRAAPE